MYLQLGFRVYAVGFLLRSLGFKGSVPDQAISA